MAPSPSLRRRALLCALPGFALGCRRSPAPRDHAPSPAASPSVAESPAAASPSSPPVAARFDASDRAFQPAPEDFHTKRPAAPGDWLARFQEPDVSFEQYADSRPVSRTSERRAIVIQPLGAFTAAERSLLERIRGFTSVFFDTPTEIAQAIELPSRGSRRRTDGPRPWTQYRTRHLLNRVLPPLLPKHAVCLLGVTMSDLYPEESWNFVFGEATLEERIGVYSLARYQPGFWGRADTPAAKRLAVLRSFKVLSHEAGHMFTVSHCVRYECVMNGSNSLEEMDRQPAFLCPVCLKKLAWNLGFDVRARYARLRAIYETEGLTAQVEWIDSRMRRIGS